MSKSFTIDELVAFGNFVLADAGLEGQVTGELIEAFNNRGAELAAAPAPAEPTDSLNAADTTNTGDSTEQVTGTVDGTE